MPPGNLPAPMSSRVALLAAGLLLWTGLRARTESTPGTPDTGPALRPRPFAITGADRSHWAFVPVRAPATPAGSHPVDHLLAARWAAGGLRPNPPATPREQVRRAHLDLWGLPPAPEVVAEFERHPTDEAWARLVDRLLASPHYGERWGRHWLDLVRYAESNGYERDGPKPHAWRYRDYVRESLDADKPYDRFVREQIAGDELAEAAIASEPTLGPDGRQALIATGFHRLHVWDDEPDDTAAAEYDDLDDVIHTTGTAFLGLTIGCARCHDHKFDPIAQADYYSMLAFFRNLDAYGRQHTGGGGRGTGRITRPLASDAEWAAWRTRQDTRLAALRRQVAQAPDAGAKRAAEAGLKQAEAEDPPFGMALAATETGSDPRPTRILLRGDVRSPGPEVSPAFPAIFGLRPPMPPSRPAGAPSTGRRRQLADWIADRSNPLTARVIANRVWLHHFGAGLVPTPDDFGLTGLPPTHPELLDHLAAELMDRGWRLKALHRHVMTSRAYRMSSRTPAGTGPGDRRGGRAAGLAPESAPGRPLLRRLDAEAIRDSILAVSGRLNPARGGPSVFPTLPPEVHTTQDSAGKGWQDSPPDEQDRRSVYLVVKRALRVPLLECFDGANPTAPTGLRPRTTVAPQALMLLNDPWMAAQADAFARRVAREAGPDPDRRIDRAFALALQRAPDAAERRAARRLLRDQAADAAPSVLRPAVDSRHRALASLCRGLLNLNEFLVSE